ncbi:MAG TPA: hypothetical protein VLB67_02985 [Acidimicrobiia bacterium]|nr:hypothetical protein [Acidimicrobiia bacterium]
MTEHDSKAEDPWEEAGRRWASIGEKLRERYREMSGEGGPSEDEVKSALETLGEAARAVADSMGSAMKDPEVRDQVKDAAASFVTAIGQTFSQLGAELRKTGDDTHPHGDQSDVVDDSHHADPTPDGP